MASLRNSAVVLSPNGADAINIDLSFHSDTAGYTKKALMRPKVEPAIKTLERIRMIHAPKQPKGKRTSREEILKMCPEVNVVDETGLELDSSKANEVYWCDAALIRYGGAEMPIKYNAPTIIGLSAPSVVVAGVPAVCSGLQLLFGTPEMKVVYEWGIAGKSEEDMVPILNHRVLIPSPELVGKKLYFRCRPDADGTMWTLVNTPPVVKPPEGSDVPQARWAHVKAPLTAPEQVRVVSYNILHDAFCTSVFAKKKLYPFASDAVLDLSNRKSRIITELRAYDGDIVCLQECGKDIFQKYYSPVLDSMGFDAVFTAKTGNVQEGLCLAVRRSRFRIVSTKAIPLQRKALDREPHGQLAEGIEEFPHFADAMERVTSVGAINVVEDVTTGQKILVGNTHLFFHPNACHIRALQAYLLAAEIEKMQRELAGGSEEAKRLPTIICGDWNFTRTTGGYKLMTTGSVGPENNCWDKGTLFWWGVDKGLGGPSEEDMESETAPATENTDAPPQSRGKSESSSSKAGSPEAPRRAGLEVTPPAAPYKPMLTLPGGIAYVDTHAADTDMKWTNYSIHFKEIIDHVFVSPDVKVLRTIPLPSKEEITKDVAIPSAVFPSDHVALVAEIELPKP